MFLLGVDSLTVQTKIGKQVGHVDTWTRGRHGPMDRVGPNTDPRSWAALVGAARQVQAKVLADRSSNLE